MASISQLNIDGVMTDLYACNGMHNIPRNTSKDITSYWRDGSLWDRINGRNGYTIMQDVFVGDYINMGQVVSTGSGTGTQYVTIAGIDTLWGNCDNSVINYHHLVMVPGQGKSSSSIQAFGTSVMNDTNITEGGYKGSKMHTTVLPAIDAKLTSIFGDHLKTTRELLSNAVDATATNNRYPGKAGASSNWEWTDCKSVLLSEVECYGSTIWSSAGFDTGNANHQLPLFFFSNVARNNRTTWYWLKDVASSFCFCGSTIYGYSYYDGASGANCVRPRFVIA